MFDKKIIVVGIGPGDEKFVTPAALEKIRSAKVLVGGRRALATFTSTGQEIFPVTKDLDAALNFIGEKILSNPVVVMVSGDPGYYSMLDVLRKKFGAEIIEVIPAISALQFAFARLALSWYDATLLSFHGRRPADDKLKFEPQKVLGLLTDGEFNSATISKILMSLGWAENSRLKICSRLSYPDEEIISTTLIDAANAEPVKHCVLIVLPAQELQIVDGTNHLDDVKRLIVEYTKFLGRDLTFQHLEEELADLPKKYLPPNGRLICAEVDGKIIGCVAYHKFDDERCEMKRLFVEEGYRKFHAGRKLITEILRVAKDDGYKEMILDTVKPLESAIHLYKKFGFVETAPYYENPMDDVIYMKKIL